MIIEKTALNKKECRQAIYFYDSARTAEKKVLDYLHEEGKFTLLLPAYIGFSANEGSGIYDPVIQTNTKHLFYKIKKDSCIDIDDLRNKLKSVTGKKMVFIVNYFGYPDANIHEVVNLCRKEDALILEDCAHALYTDYIDVACGFFGDYCIYSIHKMLPYQEGGFLKVNKEIGPEEEHFYGLYTRNEYGSIFNYDFQRIAQKRKKNATLWENLCLKNNNLSILHTNIQNATPQTFPVIIKNYDRTKLYFELNNAGFGAVSLYHTLIQPLKCKEFSDAEWLSNHIINLPVHQDIQDGKIEKMYDIMASLIGK